MAFFPKCLSREESFAMGRRVMTLIDQRGWGFWALEIPEQTAFIGFTGLHIPTDKMPFSPCVEIGWRLAKPYWGKGFATEAATAALNYAFNTLELKDVVSFTTVSNKRSQAVMRRLGMRDTQRNFMHPDIDLLHPQCEHVLYAISQSTWKSL